MQQANASYEELTQEIHHTKVLVKARKQDFFAAVERINSQAFDFARLASASVCNRSVFNNVSACKVQALYLCGASMQGCGGPGTITDAMLNLINCEQFTKTQGNSSGA
jgi:hypothetical protein